MPAHKAKKALGMSKEKERKGACPFLRACPWFFVYALRRKGKSYFFSPLFFSMVRAMRFFFRSTSRTVTLTVCPTVSTSEGCLM